MTCVDCRCVMLEEVFFCKVVENPKVLILHPFFVYPWQAVFLQESMPIHWDIGMGEMVHP